MYEPRELLAQPTTDFCNVLVIPDGKSAKYQRGCLVQVAGRGEDGRYRCGPHLREYERWLDWMDQRRAVDETGQRLRNALGTAGLDACLGQTSSRGIGATGVISVEMTPTEAEQLINRLSE
jgi:hypothetical protein